MKSENSIPFSRSDLSGHLAGRIGDPRQKEEFQALCRMIEAIYHHQFHADLEAWKSSYTSLDPDGSGVLVPGRSDARGSSPGEVVEGIRKVLTRANFREITRERIDEAFRSSSPWGLQLKVDLDDYELLALYGRGEFPESSEKKTLFIKRRYDYSVFRHVVLVFKLGKASDQGGQGGKPGKYLRDKVYVKLFKNVPTVDLEMLFPDTDIQIRLFDKMKVILPLTVGALSSLYKILGYVLGHGDIQGLWTQVGFWALVGGLFGVALKGFFSYRNTIEKYLKSLTESLYFQNLDNNSGVFTYLMDDAEEEESKELMLGYYFLAFNGGSRYRQQELDGAIEAYFRDELKTELDFEVDDSLRKLRELGLLTSEEGALRVLPLPEALMALERLWTERTLGKG